MLVAGLVSLTVALTPIGLPVVQVQGPDAPAPPAETPEPPAETPPGGEPQDGPGPAPAPEAPEQPSEVPEETSEQPGEAPDETGGQPAEATSPDAPPAQADPVAPPPPPQPDPAPPQAEEPPPAEQTEAVEDEPLGDDEFSDDEFSDDAFGDDEFDDYDPAVDSPEAVLARRRVIGGGLLLGTGLALAVGGLALGLSDPCARPAGNSCSRPARRRAALTMGLPGLAMVGAGIAFVVIGRRAQRRLAAGQARIQPSVAFGRRGGEVGLRYRF